MIQRERKQLQVAKDRLPRWAEATTAVSEHIMDEVDQKGVCMLNMSNLLRSAAPRTNTSLHPQRWPETSWAG